MVSLYKVTAEINGVKRSIEIVGKNPTYAQYKNRIDKAFNLMKKDVLNEKSVKFEVIKNNLGLGYE